MMLLTTFLDPNWVYDSPLFYWGVGSNKYISTAMNEAQNAIIQAAISRGCNAVVNMQIVPVYQYHPGGSIFIVVVYGTAIRIIDFGVRR